MIRAFLEAVLGTLTPEQRALLMRSAWVGLVSFHMVWVCGWIGFTGLEAPFARASDLRVTSDQLTVIASQLQEDRIERLELAIQTVRGQQCRTAVDSPARQNYTDRLNELYNKYWALTKREPHVPRCDET